MQVVTAPESLDPCPRVLAIGTFDGVHVGHRVVIERALDLARESGIRSSVVTFDRHPLALVDPRHVPRLLTPPAEKIRLLGELGPDEVVVLPFDEKMAALSPSEFCQELLAGALHARAVVVGENFHFGAAGAGDAAQLRSCGAAHGFVTEALPLVTEHGKPISSTRIRRLLREGDLEEVREILGRPPSATGVVAHGDKRGRTLGVPTANVDVEAGTIFPGRGVYAARVLVEGQWYRAAVNIGHNPTFRSKDAETTHVTIEAFLLDFAQDIYACGIRVDFLHKIREERRFEGPETLIAQMRSDIAAARELDDPAFVAVGLTPSPGA